MNSKRSNAMEDRKTIQDILEAIYLLFVQLLSMNY